MTKAQEIAVAKLRKMAESMHGHCSDSYEVKEWEVEENEYFVSLYFSVGIKGDEGTLAAVIGRDSCHLFIGKRGGVTYPVTKNGKNYTKRFTGRLFGVSIDQR